MKRYSVVIWIGLLFWGLTGCSDFLEEESNGIAYATNCKALDELLVGSGYMEHKVANNTESTLDPKGKKGSVYFPWLLVMDDDAECFLAGDFSATFPYTKLYGYYTWQAEPNNVESVLYTDQNWSRLYEHIGVANVVLDKVEEFTHDTEAARNAIRGQAHFIRATDYYFLVNFYAKAYDPITAGSDLGVPIKTTPYVEDENYVRDPVASVYNLIVDDLKKAIQYLDGYEPSTKRRATKAAAQVFLSRVYCYMGLWDSVPALCNAVLGDHLKYSLKDLKKVYPMVSTSKDTSWMDTNSPEVIFTQGSNSINGVFAQMKVGSSEKMSMGAFRISDDLVNTFKKRTNEATGEKDCRPDVFFKTDAFHDYYLPRKTKATPEGAKNQEYQFVSDVFTLRVSEAYLNLAEAYAMTDQEGLAREILKKLMETRIQNLQPITESGEALVKLIREERRRELCFEGHRWFDLRRYAVSPRYPELKSLRHKTYDYSYAGKKAPGIYNGYYLLPEYPDGGWVFKIPTDEIKQTEGAIVDNNREDCIFYGN